MIDFTRMPSACDRPCDKCKKPMIGIMRASFPPVRVRCEGCGGRSLVEEEMEDYCG